MKYLQTVSALWAEWDFFNAIGIAVKKTWNDFFLSWFLSYTLSVYATRKIRIFILVVNLIAIKCVICLQLETIDVECITDNVTIWYPMLVFCSHFILIYCLFIYLFFRLAVAAVVRPFKVFNFCNSMCAIYVSTHTHEWIGPNNTIDTEIWILNDEMRPTIYYYCCWASFLLFVCIFFTFFPSRSSLSHRCVVNGLNDEKCARSTHIHTNAS